MTVEAQCMCHVWVSWYSSLTQLFRYSEADLLMSSDDMNHDVLRNAVIRFNAPVFIVCRTPFSQEEMTLRVGMEYRLGIRK